MSKLKKIEIIICEDCLTGKGGECHTPGCALFLNRCPDIPIMPELYKVIKEFSDDERILFTDENAEPSIEEVNGVVQSGFRLGSTVKFSGPKPKRVRKKYPVLK